MSEKPPARPEQGRMCEGAARYRPRIRTSAPGRICLFGEHQDYLRLPVIAMAIDLRLTVEAAANADRCFRVSLPDIGAAREFPIGQEIRYESEQDFLAGAINVLRREGVTWDCGYDAQVASNIPINRGAASSSALQVAWIAFLLAAAGDIRSRDPHFIARVAHQSEVTEFDAPGGVMDHYSSALGGLVYIDCREPVHVESLARLATPFVLIDSGTPKDTAFALSRVRRPVEQAFAKMKIGLNDLHSRIRKMVPEQLAPITPVETDSLVRATVRNFHLTQQAARLLSSPKVDAKTLGALLTAHHEQLANNLRISTPDIDRLLALCIALGAHGGKINGSGGGGSCFCFCDGNAQTIASRISAEGYRACAVTIGDGVRIESPEI